MTMKPNDIFSTSFHAGRRTYFFDIKNTKDGCKYLKISESKRIGENDFDRYSIMVFQEDIDKFADAISETAKKMKDLDKPQKAYTFKDKRKKNPNAYIPWREQDDYELELLYCEGKTVKELAEIFGRSADAIQSRFKKLKLT